MEIKSIFLRLRAIHWIGILLLVLNATLLISDLLAKIVQYVIAFVVLIHDIDEKKWAVDPLDELTKSFQCNYFSAPIKCNFTSF
jgi:methyl-accepting chemotaxis protein